MKFSAILLLPITFLYSMVIRFRNHLFNIGYSRSFSFEIPVIVVGNLSAGGTGKTPMIEYLVRLFRDTYRLAILSRGYKRDTRGFRIAGSADNALTIGDEPMQYFSKWKKDVVVAVGEDRVEAIPEILFQIPEVQIILMDDGFQHRSVNPNFTIMLTEYANPFYKDFMLPSGRLRESRKEAKRAHAIIVTKCPADLQGIHQGEIKGMIHKYAPADTPIYFTTNRYGQPKSIFNKLPQIEFEKVIVLTGIANPSSLIEYATSKWTVVDQLKYTDHHVFTRNDILNISKCYSSKEDGKTILITTEKDAVRLISCPYIDEISMLPIFFIPIQIEFLNHGAEFDDLLLRSVIEVNKIRAFH